MLVTLHRRENCDDNADIVCAALIELVTRMPALRVLFPIHPNPRIARRLRRRLGGHPAFELVEPLPYAEFIRHAAGAALVISDSGGIQEEAPHLGVPLLVPRANTERAEALATGFVQLVAVERQALVDAAVAMLAAPPRAPLPFDADAPFGAGDAAARIVAVLERAWAAAARRDAPRACTAPATMTSRAPGGECRSAWREAVPVGAPGTGAARLRRVRRSAGGVAAHRAGAAHGGRARRGGGRPHRRRRTRPLRLPRDHRLFPALAGVAGRLAARRRRRRPASPRRRRPALARPLAGGRGAAAHADPSRR